MFWRELLFAGMTGMIAAAQVDPLCMDTGRFRVTDGTVHDTQHEGRLWQRRVVERLAHADAVRYCADLVIEGVKGWRLPTPVELNDIRYHPGGLFGGHRHYCVPCIDQTAFPETPSEPFWTSKLAERGTAWYVGFDDGRTHRDVVENQNWVRCTHDPLP